ncbi:MAG: glycosyltransferase family 2 protein [Patescibacteria group bacterium]
MWLDKISKKKVYRACEMIPGILVWSTFAAAIMISMWHPLWAIYFIIVFDLYWLLRVAYIMIHVLMSWKKYRHDVQMDWVEKVKNLPRFNNIYHLVVLPTYREPMAVLESSFNALVKAKYPLDKMIVVLAGEERDRLEFIKAAEIIKEKFGDKFYKFLVTVHPDNIVGEIAGKGSNIHWAGERVKELIDSLKIPYKDIVVSTLDVDSCVHPMYFAYLAHKFLTHPNPLRTSYQPVALYNNNMWESYPITRVVANSTTFWLLSDMARPERLFTFSSHSMPWQALVDVGFWQNDIVSEDSRIFWQCFVHYRGDYQVTPMYIPISMDTVYTGSFWQTMVNQYKQQRRWAYGAENLPYLIMYSLWERSIPFVKKLRYLWNMLEGYYSWATAPMIIFLLGRLPLYFLNEGEGANLIAHNAPITLQWLMGLAMFGLVLSAVLSTILLPPRPAKRSYWSYLTMMLQWILFPLTMLIFGSIPATEAQTRLLFGKYLGFWVTAKQRDVTST